MPRDTAERLRNLYDMAREAQADGRIWPMRQFGDPMPAELPPLIEQAEALRSAILELQRELLATGATVPAGGLPAALAKVYFDGRLADGRAVWRVPRAWDDEQLARASAIMGELSIRLAAGDASRPTGNAVPLTVGQLASEIGCSADTIGKRADELGIARPARGQRGRKLPASDCLRIAELIARDGQKDHRKRAREFLDQK